MNETLGISFDASTMTLNGTENGTLHDNMTLDYLDYYPHYDTLSKYETAMRFIKGFICLAGMVGNIISIVVVTLARERSPMWFILKALAVSDSIFLLCIFAAQVACHIEHDNTNITMITNCSYLEIYIYPFRMISQMVTVWLTVLVSFERYRAICFPLQSVFTMTLSKAHKTVLAVYFVAIIYNIPRFFEYRIAKNEEWGVYPAHWLLERKSYKMVYFAIFYFILHFLMPIVILLFFNIKLVLTLQDAKTKWSALKHGQKKEFNATRIPLMVVLVFFCCGLPHVVTYFLHSLQDGQSSSMVFEFWWQTSSMLLCVNSSCNFIIYCLVGNRFRKHLGHCIRCRSFKDTSYLSNSTRRSTQRGNLSSRKNSSSTDNSTKMTQSLSDNNSLIAMAPIEHNGHDILHAENSAAHL